MKIYKIIKYDYWKTRNCKKPNIFEIESVIKEHLKSAIELWKAIKQPAIITKKPKKIKVSTDSRAADQTLQEHLIKRHTYSS